jgi:hypothetical protein
MAQAADVMALDESNDRDVLGPREIDTHLGGISGGDLTERPIASDEGACRAVLDHGGVRYGIDPIRMHVIDIPGQMDDAVRVDASQVRLDEVIRDDLGVFSAGAGGEQDIAGEIE